MTSRLAPPTRPLAALLLAACLSGCGDPPPDRLSGVLRYEYPYGPQRSGHLHYDLAPPVGGAHNALWQTCGIYAQPLYDEYAVHTLARGAVWLTYRPDLPAAEVAQLSALTRGQPLTLLSPYPGQTAAVTASAWNVQMQAQNAADPRLARFIREFAGAKGGAPEQGLGCSGGTQAVRPPA
ncbi:DUF3105 domain-containing protein [Deinococcus lacus]|uniref:DUF3105 domain-containing protein n=1 Tax=Deinococcus lacus TaxID=392561 RepID=A0ABW1YF69_9DEIO